MKNAAVKKTTALRNMLRNEGLSFLMEAHDGLSAKIAEGEKENAKLAWRGVEGPSRPGGDMAPELRVSVQADAPTRWTEQVARWGRIETEGVAARG